MRYIQALARGKGGLKYYSYWVSNIRLTTKKAIREAIELKLKVMRKDMIMGYIEKYDYKTESFERVNEI